MVTTFIMSSVTMTIILSTSLAPVEEKPEGQFSFHYSDQKVIITYDKGQAIPSEEVSVEATSPTTITESDWDDGVITAKDEIVVQKNGHNKWNGESVTVIWESEDGEGSAILAQDESPKIARLANEETEDSEPEEIE